ncbi:MAG: DNA polymerase/3'-5' exonuclease PolX [Planctomycetota bacterium]
MENAQIAEIFDTIADLIDLKGGNQYRVRSYRAAARSVRDHSGRLEELVEQGADLTDIPNIGEKTADKIREIVETGTCKRLEELREELPEGLTELMNIPRVGPRKAKEIYDELGIESLDDLKSACEDGRIRDLPGMGEKTEQNILEGIETIESTTGRILYKEAADHVGSLARHLDGLDALKRWEVAGSFRRRKETVGDLDVLVEAKDRAEATDRILEYEPIDDVLSRGKERVSVRLKSGLRIDFRFFQSSSFGSALLYFTGSKAHNIALRRRAQDRGWKLNEYGLLKGDNRLASQTEEAIYPRLDLAWTPPELRENRGEVDAAENDALPDLVELDDIRGDLQSHTKETDGTNTIEEMAQAAKDRGYDYLAITDHSKAVSVAQGMDDDRARKHADRVRQVSDDMDDFWLMAGVEVDILKSGKLDLDEDVLADLDWVIASTHFHLNLGRDKMTDRIVKAVESGLIHAIAHPLQRVIGKRDPIDLDVDRLFEVCAENDVCLEINAQPDRLDLPDSYCQRAIRAGITFTIGTDAHKAGSLDFMRFGVGAARRGWLEKKNVLNTKTIKQLRKTLQGG